MKPTDRTVRRHLLKPLVRRRVSPSQIARIETAFGQLEERALASAVLPEMVAELKRVRLEGKKDSWKDPDEAKTRIQLAIAMYLARRISLQEYIFLIADASEGVHQGRIIAKTYPELEQLAAEMRQIEADHGPTHGQYWLLQNAPAAYRGLSSKWSAACVNAVWYRPG
jgi:hypothetical protein